MLSETTRIIRNFPGDVQILVAEKRISMGHAKAILGLPEEDMQRNVAQKAAAQDAIEQHSQAQRDDDGDRDGDQRSVALHPRASGPSVTRRWNCAASRIRMPNMNPGSLRLGWEMLVNYWWQFGQGVETSAA